jgi:hypothetical protein
MTVFRSFSDLVLRPPKICAHFDPEEDTMISSFRNFPALFAACLIAPLVCGVAAAAESIENQCRIAVRAEMMGPDCRVINPRTSSGAYTGNDPCYILGDAKMTYYIEKVMACVKRGGPGRR